MVWFSGFLFFIYENKSFVLLLDKLCIIKVIDTLSLFTINKKQFLFQAATLQDSCHDPPTGLRLKLQAKGP